MTIEVNRNIPPVAHKVICIDFDGTIFKWGDLHAKSDPFVGVVDFMRALKKDGWTIVIFTSRLSPTWWDAEGFDMSQAFADQTAWVKQRLDNFGIPFDRITAEKIPAEYYIDDKAIEFTGSDWAWRDIRKRVLG